MKIGIWVLTTVAQLGRETDISADYFILLPSPIQTTEQEFKPVSVIHEPRHCQYVQVKSTTWARYAD